MSTTPTLHESCFSDVRLEKSHGIKIVNLGELWEKGDLDGEGEDEKRGLMLCNLGLSREMEIFSHWDF